MKIFSCFIFLALLLTACQPGAVPSAVPVTASPTASPPTATPEPGPLFTPVQPGPVFARGQKPWFADVVEPGAVIFHEGQFHLFFNGFTGWPAKVAIGYATSPDGMTWTLASPNPILDSARETFDGYTFFASSVLVENDAWILYLYTLAEGRDGAPGQIYRATASDPAGRWTLDPLPSLTPGGEGAWDAVRVTDPSVIRTPEGFRMYYTGANTDRLQATRMIGLATSSDGLTWTKSVAPVLALGEKGAWDAFRVFQPHVVQTPDGFWMLYKANIKVGQSEGFGLAYSQDGLVWERYAGNPIMVDKTYRLDWLRKGYAELLYHEGRFYLYLEVLEREGGPYAHGNTDYRSNVVLLAWGGEKRK
ncbi:MAG: hypothetical protein Fur0022_48550 [Anaerolineales bacterium]